MTELKDWLNSINDTKKNIIEFAELIYEGHLIPGYYINTDGKMFSTRNNKGLNRWYPNNKQLVCYGGKMRKLSGTKCGKYTLYRLGTKFTYKENLVSESKFGVLAHRAVMETFNPFEDNLPEDLIEEWSNLSSIVRRYIINGWTIDHKEDLNDSSDSLSNLQWMTRNENAAKGNRNHTKGNRNHTPTILEKMLWN